MGRRGRGAKQRKTAGSSEVRAQGTGPVKRTQRNPFDPHGSDEFTYSVREIKAEGQRFGKPAWLIGWEGFDDSADTWEPIENLAGHEQDIAAFRQKEEARLAELAATNSQKRKATNQEPEQTRDDGDSNEEDGWVEGLGGRRKAECWRFFKVRLDPENSDKIALWIVRNNRPLSICEHDVELHDVFTYIFHGGYTPPTAKLVLQNILKLSVEGKEKAKGELAKLFAEERLLAAIPFGGVRHNADEMELATKRACADLGIGVFEESEEGDILKDTVVDCIHASASDSASNIVKGWKEAVQLYDVEQPRKAASAVDDPDGSRYRDHKLQLLEWDVAKEVCYLLEMTSDAIDILQSTSIVTASLVLPVIGRLTYKLDAETPIKYGGKFVKLTVVERVAARETLWEQVESRFHNQLLDCKLEDFAVATFLDPRYRVLDFHN
ncbi:La ribonucleoprotein [Cymbomonas tetramitiformis]|uniref:La ribonucleoprotein n=1 Tax=Cymbomonas tetramitiformis TaxID=36881 RepID=A0AAE0GX93_9CHLO|nr:La ribonucleoprotein [Cymbomonas tetramitiformis]